MTDQHANAMSPAAPGTPRLLGARIRVPRHIVYRRFPEETVLLDVNTGTYHAVAARVAAMLDALQKAASVGEAASVIAARRHQAQVATEQDMCALCELLLARGLLEVAG
jgi:hypothetical protein